MNRIVKLFIYFHIYFLVKLFIGMAKVLMWIKTVTISQYAIYIIIANTYRSMWDPLVSTMWQKTSYINDVVVKKSQRQ